MALRRSSAGHEVRTEPTNQRRNRFCDRLRRWPNIFRTRLMSGGMALYDSRWGESRLIAAMPREGNDRWKKSCVTLTASASESKDWAKILREKRTAAKKGGQERLTSPESGPKSFSGREGRTNRCERQRQRFRMIEASQTPRRVAGTSKA